jgi:hypothetical protein
MKPLLALALLALVPGWAVDFRPPRFPAGATSRWDSLLRRQVRFLLGQYAGKPLPYEEEHALRPVTSTALSAAVCVRAGLCDAAARDQAIGLLRTVASTHLTSGGVTANGKAWGHQWQSALWAWQGAFAAWLLWDSVPPDVRSQIVAVTADEADRFLDLPAPYAEFFDTKGEENSWNSLLLVLAAVAMPDHPHAARWEQRGIEYMLSAAATREDARAGKSGLRGANVHSDFTLENHGFVHPDYMSAVPFLNLHNALVYRLAGKPVPQACLYHAAPIYDILKRLTLPDGGVLYPSGTDWCLHRIDNWAPLHEMMARIAGDPQGEALASLGLATLEKMQARAAEGRTFLPGEFPTYPTHEGQAGWMYAAGKLTALLWPPPPKSDSLASVWRSLSGGMLLDDAKWLILRTPQGVASFSWGLRLLGQTVPFSEDPVTMPLLRSYVGAAADLPAAGGGPSRLGIASKALQSALDADAFTPRTVISGEESGAYHVTIAGEHGRDRQSFSFTALPSGKTVFISRGKSQSGVLFLLEEPQWVYGSRERRIQHDERTWLNVDGRLGYVVSGGSGIQVRPELRGKLAVLAPATPAPRDTIVVTLPGADAAQTKQFAASPVSLETGDPGVLAARVDGYLIVSSFISSPRQVTVAGRTVSVYGCSTRVLPR